MLFSLNAVCVRNEEVETEVNGIENNDVEIEPGNEVEYCDTEYEVLDVNLNEQSE